MSHAKISDGFTFVEFTNCGGYEYVFDIIAKNNIAFNVIYKDTYYVDNTYIDTYFYDNYEDMIKFNNIDLFKNIKKFSTEYLKEQNIETQQIYYLPYMIGERGRVFVDLVIKTINISEKDEEIATELNAKLCENYNEHITTDGFNKWIYYSLSSRDFDKTYAFSSTSLTLNGKAPYHRVIIFED